ncbi:hypothetical protein ABZ860_06960 [Microbispora sp. NPDC046973]|uniref:hypothetical protein n=1 Tax=Microbispora sp. NPDC046973 TaxID=3155022 RepID=UPI0033D77109
MGNSAWDWPAPTASTSQSLRSFDDMIDDPSISSEEGDRLKSEAIVGTAAVLLLRRGDSSSARLLLDVVRVVSEWNEEERESWLWLEVNAEQRAQFTEQIMKETLRPVCLEVMKRRQHYATWVDVREMLPSVGPDWRDQVKMHLSGKGVTNQGRRARLESPRIVEDNFVFTNPGELAVYKTLRKVQEQDFPSDDTIGIFPLPGVRIPGHSWEPDLLVTYKGRAGVLEVDGPHHNGRRALDGTRDHLLRDAGVAVVDRIPVEALNSASELSMAIRRFLKRLSEAR